MTALALMLPAQLGHVWIMIACALLVILLASTERVSSAGLTVFATIAAGAAAVAGMQTLAASTNPVILCSGTVIVDRAAVTCSIVCALCTAAVLATTLGGNSISRSVERHFTGLLLLTAASLMLAAHAHHLAVLLVATESAALGLAALLGLGRAAARGSEAASKAVVVGAVAFGLASFGMALIYGGSGGIMNYGGLTAAAAKGPSAVATAGAFLVVAAFLFRLGAAPFHMAAPDLLDGAPLPAAMFSVSAFRVCFAVAMLRLLQTGFFNIATTADVTGMAKYVAWAAAASMLIGAVGAVRQQHLKRLLAYLSISQLGFALLAMVALSQNAPTAMMAVGACLLSPAVALLVAFAALTYLSSAHDGNPFVDDLTGLARQRPLLPFALAIAMLALTGMPFTVGFSGLFVTLLSSFSTPFMMPLAVVGLVAFLIGLYPTFRLIVAMYFREPAHVWPDLSPPGATTVLLAGTAALLLFGVVTNPWLAWARLLVP